MLRSKKPQQGPATCQLLPRSRRIFVCSAWFRFGEVTMGKTHLDKTLDPTPFLSSRAPSLSAWGSACGWHVSRTPPLGTPTRLYVPLLPAWHGLAVGELPTVKDVPVPSSMAARSRFEGYLARAPARYPSTTASWNPAASSCAWRARSRKGSPSPLSLSFCSTYNTKGAIRVRTFFAGPHPKAGGGYGGVKVPRGIMRQCVGHRTGGR